MMASVSDRDRDEPPRQGRWAETPAPVALVTGASSGIGRAIAIGLAGRGARLHLTGRRQASLEATARAVLDHGATEPKCYQADLAVETELRSMAGAVAQGLTGLDVLVHAAGDIARGPVAVAPAADLDALYRVNVRAPYLLTQLLLPLLRSANGQVVFINSSAGLSARAESGPYGASKHALRALADALREEVNPEGVRVTSIYAGRTATPMQASLHALDGRPYDPRCLLQPEDVADAVVAVLGLARTAEVTDLHLRPMRGPGPGAGRP